MTEDEYAEFIEQVTNIISETTGAQVIIISPEKKE